MAITTYSELQASVANFLLRDDLTAEIKDFISLAESQVNRDVRHYLMENRATTTIDGRFATRPSDWVETIRLHLTGSGTSELHLISQADMATRRQKADDTTGTPKFYAHSETQFEVYPTPSGSFDAELLYMQKIPALSDANTSNWLLSAAPDVYLYGALIHSAGFLGEDERATVWASLYAAAVGKLNNESVSAKYSGVSLRSKIRGLG